MKLFTGKVAAIVVAAPLVMVVGCTPVGKPADNVETLSKMETDANGNFGVLECRSSNGSEYDALQIHVSPKSLPETDSSTTSEAHITLQQDVVATVVHRDQKSSKMITQVSGTLARAMDSKGQMQKISLLANEKSVVLGSEEVAHGVGSDLAQFTRIGPGRVFKLESGIAGLKPGNYDCREFKVNYDRPSVGEASSDILTDEQLSERIARGQARDDEARAEAAKIEAAKIEEAKAEAAKAGVGAAAAEKATEQKATEEKAAHPDSSETL